MLWRRCCVDVDETGQVIGASIEFYDDVKLKPNLVAVLARGEWNGLTPAHVIRDELNYAWPHGRRGLTLVGYEEELPFPSLQQPSVESGPTPT